MLRRGTGTLLGEGGGEGGTISSANTINTANEGRFRLNVDFQQGTRAPPRRLARFSHQTISVSVSTCIEHARAESKTVVVCLQHVGGT